MTRQVPLSMLAGVVQTHLDLARLIPDRLLKNGRHLLLAIEQLTPTQQDEVARALLRLRVCGGYLSDHLIEVGDSPDSGGAAVARHNPGSR